VNGAVVAAAGITAFAAYMFLAEWDRLDELRASRIARILTSMRWALVFALAWALLAMTWMAPAGQRVSTIIGVAALIAALMLVPVEWFIQLAGRDARWELRRVKIESGRLANRIRTDRDPAAMERLEPAIDQIERLRTPETAELCDLLIAELSDLRAGSESWTQAGRRTIRIDELSRQLWPGVVRPPDFDTEEATFRWRMYRTFGQMMDIGVMDLSPRSRKDFKSLVHTLGEFRRPDTEAFIDQAQASADRWLARRSSRKSGSQAFGLEVLGPEGRDEMKRIWGRDAALWGAQLEEDDLRALDDDLARHAVLVSESRGPESQD
jgi:hypothetical protein